MKVVWSSEVPIEYRAPRCSIAYIVRVITPVLIIVLSLCMVVSSYYIAPDTFTFEDDPIIKMPEYFLASGTVQRTISAQTSDYVTHQGFLFSSFPMFRDNLAFSQTPNYKFSTGWNGYRYLDIELAMNDLAATGKALGVHTIDGQNLFIGGNLLIPFEIYLPKKNMARTLSIFNLHFEYPGSFKKYSINADLHLEQRASFESISENLTTFINRTFNSQVESIDIEHTIKAFQGMPFRASLKHAISSFTPATELADIPTISLHLRVPSLIIEEQAPFWNIFRNTYVQLFYWAWVVTYFWGLLIDGAFTYHIFPTAEVHLIKERKIPN